MAVGCAILMLLNRSGYAYAGAAGAEKSSIPVPLGAVYTGVNESPSMSSKLSCFGAA